MNKYGTIKKGIVLGLICNLFCSPILVHAADWRYSNGTTGFQQQEKPVWCWAASARNMAVSKYTSVNVTKSQEEVVKEIKGDAYMYETGTIKEAARAIISFNKSASAKGIESVLTLTKIKSEIDKGRAVLLGMEHAIYGKHAIIIYGYDYDSSQVKIYDPRLRDSIHSFANLRDGRALPGYKYIETAHFN